MKKYFKNQIIPSAGIEPATFSTMVRYSNHSLLHHTTSDWVVITYLIVAWSDPNPNLLAECCNP